MAIKWKSQHFIQIFLDLNPSFHKEVLAGKRLSLAMWSFKGSARSLDSQPCSHCNTGISVFLTEGRWHCELNYPIHSVFACPALLFPTFPPAALHICSKFTIVLDPSLTLTSPFSFSFHFLPSDSTCPSLKPEDPSVFLEPDAPV